MEIGGATLDLRTLQTNMVPYKALHYLCAAYAPLQSPKLAPYESLSITDLTHQLFHPSMLLANCNHLHGKHISISLFYCGRGLELGDCLTSVGSIS